MCEQIPFLLQIPGRARITKLYIIKEAIYADKNNEKKAQDLPANCRILDQHQKKQSINQDSVQK